MVPSSESKTLSRSETKILLSTARETDEQEWKILSYMVATGKRASQVSSAFDLTAEEVIGICRKYDVTPHMLRWVYAIELQDLGVHPNIIEMLLGHSRLENEKKRGK